MFVQPTNASGSIRNPSVRFRAPDPLFLLYLQQICSKKYIPGAT